MLEPSLVTFQKLPANLQKGPFALPPRTRPYALSMKTVYSLFVRQAPFRDEREFLFEALHHYLRRVASYFPTAVFWINGGFTTWKEWEPPGDIDIVVILNRQDLDLALRTLDGLQLWTMLTVSAEQPGFSGLPKFQPYGGLIDSFPVLADIGALGYWYDLWSTVKAPNGTKLEGSRKGYVEVAADELI